MEFIETKAFTKRALEFFEDGHYGLFQAGLVANPEAGDVIPGSGGIRKIRWGLDSRGKRGGLRILYQWIPEKSQVFLLFVFGKNEQSDLTPAQLAVLRKLMEDEKNG